jgi:hypothetical protein
MRAEAAPSGSIGCAPPSTGPDQSLNSEADADADAFWFPDHPQRRYRIRAGQAIRLVKGTFLRTRLDAPVADTSESAAEAARWTAAYPTASEAAREKMARRACRRAR